MAGSMQAQQGGLQQGVWQLQPQESGNRDGGSRVVGSEEQAAATRKKKWEQGRQQQGE